MKYLISDVTSEKGKILLTFEDGEILPISKENYLRFGYLYEGKELTEKEVEDLKKYEKDYPCYLYVRYMVKNNILSNEEMKKRLAVKKRISYDHAENIIKDLQNEGVVDENRSLNFRCDELKDKFYAPRMIREILVSKYLFPKDQVAELEIDYLKENDSFGEYISHLLSPNYPSKQRKEILTKNLLKKGFNKDEIEKIYLSHADETIEFDYDERIFDREFLKLNNKFKKMNYKMRCNNIRRELSKLGYPIEAIEEKLSSIGEDDNQIQEVSEKYYLQAKNKSGTPQKREAFFINKLLGLGYTLGDIKEIIRENEYEF